MTDFDRKAHWEQIYQTKQLEELGWFQAKPETSLSFFKELKVKPADSIIDVGGGDSFLVDHLLDMGYTNITVLDISVAAIERVKKRLGEKASQVNWIVADILDLEPGSSYDLWHDRAAFHFLTDDRDVHEYSRKVDASLKSGGHMVLGTFTENGPKKCSGISIRQYSEESIEKTFWKRYRKLKCIQLEHVTPSNTSQNFLFCCFKKS